MPSAIECHIAFRADGVSGGSGSFQSAPIMNRKLMASTKKAQATPNAWITKPAGMGPTMVVSCAVLWLTEEAATSCSRLTSEGMYVGCAKGKRQSVQFPGLQNAQPDEQANHGDTDGSRRGSRHHDFARRQAVADGAAHQHQNGTRNCAAHHDGPHGNRRARLLQDQPRQSHEIELIPEEGNRSANEP